MLSVSALYASLVDGIAVGATSLLFDTMTAIPANVVCAVMVEVATQGEDDVGYEERIAYPDKGGETENHVADGADGKQSEQIEQGCTWHEQAYGIINGSDGSDDEHPEEKKEECQQQRLGERIQ